jgi:ABC-2 type transport system permease protein
MLRVALREYLETVKTKGFLIGIALAPVLMSGSIIAVVIFENRVDVKPRKVAVLDHTGVVAEALVEAAAKRNSEEIFDKETGEQVRPAFQVEAVELSADLAAQRLALSDRVRRKELIAYVEIGPEVIHPGEDAEAARIGYHTENMLYEDFRRWMTWPINSRLRELRTAEAELDREKVDRVVQWMQPQTLGLVSVDEATGAMKDAKRSNVAAAVGVPGAMVLLMFMMIMMGATPLLNSVMEEKTLHIAEVLLGSMRPFDLMMGKLLGNLAVALTAATVYSVAGAVGLTIMGLGEHMPYWILPWFFAYTAAAIFMFGALNSAVGAACNDAKELQSMALPVMLPAMLPMFIIVPVLKDPLGAFATITSLFPPFTPILMMLRLGTPGGIPMWQPWAGLLGVAACAVLFVWAGGRIFRIGLLAKGQPPKLGLLLKWAIRG